MEKKLAAQFNRGMESLEDNPCLRRPVTVTKQKTISRIDDIIMADRRVTEHYLVTDNSHPQRTSYV